MALPEVVRYNSRRPKNLGDALSFQDDELDPAFDSTLTPQDEEEIAQNDYTPDTDAIEEPTPQQLNGTQPASKYSVKPPVQTMPSPAQMQKAATPPPNLDEMESAEPSAPITSPTVKTTPVVSPKAKVADVNLPRLEETQKRLEEAHANRPAPPKDNVIQRLSNAVLAFTRFAPIREEILHPKYSQERRDYDSSLKDLENQLGEQQKAAAVEATIANRDSQIANREANTAIKTEAEQRMKDTAQDKAQSARDRIYVGLTKAQEAAVQHQMKGMEGDSIPIREGDPLPAGFEKYIANPNTPGYGWAVPSPQVKVTGDLAEFAGVPDGTMIPRSRWNKALDDKNKYGRTVKDQKQNLDYHLGVVANPKSYTPEEVQVSKNWLKEAERHNQSMRPISNNTSIFPPPTAATSQLTGQAYLDTLSPAQLSRVMQVVTGAVPYPTNRGPEAEAMRNAVAQADPGFNAQRAQVRKAFASTKEGQNIRANNTAVVHLDQLGDVSKALGNGSLVPGNAVHQYFSRMLGGAAPDTFESLRNAVAGEMASALKGQATDVEIQNIAQTIQKTASPAAMESVIKENLKVLAKKLNTYEESYRQYSYQGTGAPDNAWSPVLPTARKVLAKYGVSGDEEAPTPASSAGGAKQKPTVQRSEKTGAYRYSLDGGITWHPGQPPK